MMTFSFGYRKIRFFQNAFSTYKNFSEKLVFQKVLRTHEMNDPLGDSCFEKVRSC